MNYDANKTANLAADLLRGKVSAADMLHAIALEWSNNWLSIEAFAQGQGLTWHEAASLTELARIVANRRTANNKG